MILNSNTENEAEIIHCFNRDARCMTHDAKMQVDGWVSVDGRGFQIMACWQ